MMFHLPTLQAALRRPVQIVFHLRGAREHNLKNVDLDLPRDKLIVMTGLSGSGKSSLAFDTIYAEGQRRYVESLSAYARQFLEMMQKPDVDQIDGSVAGHFHRAEDDVSRNPRSTVGTVTEIYDYMRLLFARVGVPYSPATGLPIESQTVSQMVDRVMALEEGTRLYPGADRARPQGRVPQGIRRADEEGLPAREGRRQFYEIADARRSTRNTSTTSTSWWTASSCAMTSRAPCRQPRPASAGRRIAIAEFADKPLPRPETSAGGGQQVEDDP
jgi:excinuclease ABC subunit A